VLLDAKVLALQAEFDRSSIPHAFGGALALAYWATPRATVDIDVNVFVGLERSQEVVDALARLGVEPLDAVQRETLARDEQVRVRWGGTPVDLFFSYDALHDSCMRRRQRAPLGDDDEIQILSAEDLFIFKVLFDRAKDWRDIEELLFCQGEELDRAYVRDWLQGILPAHDTRHLRLEALFQGRSP
jgi:hypothetical protein